MHMTFILPIIKVMLPLRKSLIYKSQELEITQEEYREQQFSTANSLDPVNNKFPERVLLSKLSP